MTDPNATHTPLSIRDRAWRAAPAAALLLAAALPARALDAPLAADTTVHLKTPAQNFGHDGRLLAGGPSTAFLRFDLSGLPPGTVPAHIRQAQLLLYVSQSSAEARPGAIARFELRRVHGPWDEHRLTFDNAPPQDAPGGGRVFQVTQARQFVAVDLTDWVRGWVANPGSHHGLALSSALDTAQAMVALDSKENTGTGHVARLQLTLADQGPRARQGPSGPAGRPGSAARRASPGRPARRARKASAACPGRRASVGRRGLWAPPVPPARKAPSAPRARRGR
jgi:hypothetical protein